MGLDTSHNCWHGPYSAFNFWRNELAQVAGYAVWKVVDIRCIPFPTVMLDWGHITPKELMGVWDRVQQDPLVYLIAHCDDEGVIKPAQAGPLATRLRELAPLLQEDVLRSWTMQFAVGLEDAVSRGEDVEFH